MTISLESYLPISPLYLPISPHISSQAMNISLEGRGLDRL